MFARLTLYETDCPARQVLLDEQTRYLVGREESCGISIDDPTLSRRHARIAFRDGEWRLADLASKNGTLVAGRRISQHPLADGDWIEIGGVLACFDRVSRKTLEADERRLGEQWQTSIHLSRFLKPRMQPAELLGQVLESFVTVSGTDRGFVMLQNPSGEFHPDVSQPAGEQEFSGSRSVVARTFEQNRAIVCCDVVQDAVLGPQPSIAGAGISTLACVPLRVGEKLLGVIYVDSQQPGKRFTDLDIELLQAMADHAALVIAVSRLRENIVDLTHMLPPEMQRAAPPDAALIEEVQRHLPHLVGKGAGSAPVAGVDR